jgi:hypothetical protein
MVVMAFGHPHVESISAAAAQQRPSSPRSYTHSWANRSGFVLTMSATAGTLRPWPREMSAAGPMGRSVRRSSRATRARPAEREGRELAK